MKITLFYTTVGHYAFTLNNFHNYKDLILVIKRLQLLDYEVTLKVHEVDDMLYQMELAEIKKVCPDIKIEKEEAVPSNKYRPYAFYSQFLQDRKMLAIMDSSIVKNLRYDGIDINKISDLCRISTAFNRITPESEVVAYMNSFYMDTIIKSSNVRPKAKRAYEIASIIAIAKGILYPEVR